MKKTILRFQLLIGVLTSGGLFNSGFTMEDMDEIAPAISSRMNSVLGGQFQDFRQSTATYFTHFNGIINSARLQNEERYNFERDQQAFTTALANMFDSSFITLEAQRIQLSEAVREIRRQERQIRALTFQLRLLRQHPPLSPTGEETSSAPPPRPQLGVPIGLEVTEARGGSAPLPADTLLTEAFLSIRVLPAC